MFELHTYPCKTMVYTIKLMLMRGKRERAQKRIRFSNAEKNSSKTNLNLSDPNIIFEPKKVFQN